MERTAQVVNDAVDNLGAEADASLIKLLDSGNKSKSVVCRAEANKIKAGEANRDKGIKSLLAIPTCVCCVRFIKPSRRTRPRQC